MADPESLIDAYADGQLTGDERADFERQLQDRPELASQIERHREVDGALRRLFHPPSQERLRSIVDGAREATGNGSALRRPWPLATRRLAVAAGLAAAVLGLWQIWAVLGPGGPPAGPGYEGQPWRNLETVYRDTIAEGFQPAWVCKDDAEFAQTFWGLYRQKLLLAELPTDVAVLGLSPCNTITRRTTSVLARAGGREVMAFVDWTHRDWELDPVPGFHLFRRPVGRLVLYELTPLDHPSLLGSFYDPDAREGDEVEQIEEIER